jgi:hypothetical protein
MKLTDLQLHKENGKYYLSAIFLHEDNKGIYEASIPKIEFPIPLECELNSTSYVDSWNRTVHYEANVDFGFCKLDVLPFDGKDKFFTMTCLEEKVHEMTLDEIEKALGYKIKLKEN